MWRAWNRVGFSICLSTTSLMGLCQRVDSLLVLLLHVLIIMVPGTTRVQLVFHYLSMIDILLSPLVLCRLVLLYMSSQFFLL